MTNSINFPYLSSVSRLETLASPQWGRSSREQYLLLDYRAYYITDHICLLIVKLLCHDQWFRQVHGLPLNKMVANLHVVVALRGLLEKAELKRIKLRSLGMLELPLQLHER